MLVGHFGLALCARAIRPTAPLRWLVLSTYAPDLVKLVARLFLDLRSAEIISHSLPAVAAISALLAAAWLHRGGSSGVAWLLVGLCSAHAAVDMLTGCKPLLPNGPWLGLQLYAVPLNDLILELGTVALGWALVRQRRAFPTLLRGWPVLAAATVLQLAYLAGVAWRDSVFLFGRMEYLWLPSSRGLWPQPVGRMDYPSCYEPMTTRLQAFSR